jgi:hypothetical protein
MPRRNRRGPIEYEEEDEPEEEYEEEYDDEEENEEGDEPEYTIGPDGEIERLDENGQIIPRRTPTDILKYILIVFIPGSLIGILMLVNAPAQIFGNYTCLGLILTVSLPVSVFLWWRMVYHSESLLKVVSVLFMIFVKMIQAMMKY